VIEGLRGEFPGASSWVARLEKPAITRETVGWALLSALGAAFIVEAIVRIALMAIYPAVFPATEPHPEWLTPSLISNVAGGFVAAAVALRAGGIGALGAYVAYEILLLLAALPGRAILCERSGGLAAAAVCWSPTSFLTERWPIWLAIALGVVAARLLRGRAGEGNWLLRGAGAFTIIATALGSMLGLVVTVTGTGANPNTVLLSVLFLLIQTVAGIAAGLILARSPLAGAVLVALLIVGPTLAFALPLALRNGLPTEPVEFTFARWLGVLIPLLGAAALLASRASARSKGTFS